MLRFIVEVFTVATALATAGYVVAGAYQFIRRKLSKEAARHDAPLSEAAPPLVHPWTSPPGAPLENSEPPPASAELHKPEHPTLGRDEPFSTSVIALVVVVAIACSVALWMGRYRFEQINLENGESYPVRINRVTGNSEVLYRGVWKPASELPKLPPLVQDLKPEELAKLRGQADLFTEGPVFKLTLYNGSGFTLKEITVEISVRDSHGEEVLRRTYRFQQRHSVQQTAEYSEILDFSVGPGQTWAWRIASAKGIKS